MSKNISIILNYPKRVCTIFFIVHSLLLLSHGIFDYYFSDYDIILDIIILFLLQSITLFITLSKNYNNLKFFRLSLFLSLLHFFAIIYSILVYCFCLIIHKETYCIRCSNKEKKLNWGIFLLFIKSTELIPLLALILACRKIKNFPNKREIKINGFDINENYNGNFYEDTSGLSGE